MAARLLRLAAAAACCAAPAAPQLFEPQCTSSSDWGWPRFRSRAELQANASWAAYFDKVYGELPSLYPLCVYDLWTLDQAAYEAAGLGGTRPIVAASQVREGDLYVQTSTVSASGKGAYGIYHSQWKPVPNHTWIEVSHEVYPTEQNGSWAWQTRGSGIWYNVGRTKVFPTPANILEVHADAIAFLRDGCSVDVSYEWPLQESQVFGLCAREKGYDSIQFEPQDGAVPIGTFDQTGLTEMVLVNADGDKTCGVVTASETPYRTGWRASQQCECVNEPIAESCGLMPVPLPPYTFTGEEPRLCRLREDSLLAFCDPTACKPTTCNNLLRCDQQLATLCGRAQHAGKGNCLVCTGQHQRALVQAHCTQPDFEAFCR